MTIMKSEKENWHYAIIYQVTQECPFKCDICLRFYEPGGRALSHEERLLMVAILKQHNVKSISITGGEPLILKDSLFDFLRYLNHQHIHTCLATTGFGLDKERVIEMDEYLDRMVISIRSLDIENWKVDFGDTAYTLQLFDTVLSLLHWVNSTSIILEVTAVLHKQNIGRIIELGQQLADLNPNVVWRIDEYYPIGKEAHNRERFELDDGQFEQTSVHIRQEFLGCFRDIQFSSWSDRKSSPGLLITQSGDIVTSAGQSTGLNIMKGEFPAEFIMSRPWSEYRKVCRDWGWDD